MCVCVCVCGGGSVTPVSASVFPWPLPPWVSASQTSPCLPYGFRARCHLHILTLITYANTLFLNKVTFRIPGGHEADGVEEPPLEELPQSFPRGEGLCRWSGRCRRAHVASRCLLGPEP